MKSTEQIEQELQILRKRWTSEPLNRESISLQGRALKIALELRTGKRESRTKFIPPPTLPTIQNPVFNHE